MGALGWLNGGPLELGGGTTKVEDVYSALRSIVGVGGAGPVDSLEDLWRQAKAQAIGASLISIERAVLQALPAYATDHVPVYERVLGIVPASGATEEDRRQATTEAWVLDILSQMPSIERGLQAIDDGFGLDEVPYDKATIVHFGRMFPPFGAEATRGVPAYPNYADDFVLRATFSLDDGTSDPGDAVVARAARLLNNVLPAWIDWSIATLPDGFYLDGGDDGTSLLDLKAFD